MGRVPEAKLVIKHTFLEYVGDDKELLEQSLTRQRSNTEPLIFDNLCYDAVREELHGSESSSSSSHQGEYSVDNYDAWKLQTSPQASFIASVLATPEMTPLLYPMARHVPGWLQEDWAECLLPEAYFDPQAMNEYCQWTEQNSMGNWWAPNEAYELPPPVACSQFQLEYSALEQSYAHAPMSSSSSNFDASQLASNEVDAAQETRTTVMLRDLPEDYSRSTLLKLLDSQGFFGRFDFIYLPVDFKHRRNLGYALINLISPCEALRLTEHFEGFSTWDVVSDKICSVGWCFPQQGLEAHVERYRNSPVMHESVPAEWQPMLLSHGVPVPFPAPTIKIKAPKVKGRQT